MNSHFSLRGFFHRRRWKKKRPAGGRSLSRGIGALPRNLQIFELNRTAKSVPYIVSQITECMQVTGSNDLLDHNRSLAHIRSQNLCRLDRSLDLKITGSYQTTGSKDHWVFADHWIFLQITGPQLPTGRAGCSTRRHAGPSRLLPARTRPSAHRRR